jgi:hypothetical protein
MRAACAHTKACPARLSEYQRQVSGHPRDPARDDLHRRYLGAGENATAVRRGAVHRDALGPERSPDGLVPEPPVEIPATGALGLLPKERQNLLDIVDPTVARRWAYGRRSLRPGGELGHQPVQERCQALQVAQL